MCLLWRYYNALALTQQLAAPSNARSEAQRYTVERQLMTGGIISRENLINQTASKQRPVLPVLSVFLCAHLPPAAVSSGTVLSPLHYSSSDARIDAFAKRTTSSLDRCFAWSNALIRCAELLSSRGELQ